MTNLWSSASLADWRAALKRYDAVIAEQDVQRLPELDCWYREELPKAIAARQPPHVTLDELVRATEWKMKRGVWRARNLSLMRGNPAAQVEEISARALAAAPHPTRPIALLSELAGVGPATASAVAAAAAPEQYPFFDELVAAQVPGLGKVAFTLGYYSKYADALRERSKLIGNGWTPVMVERALWANSGGKTRQQP
jgi:hypothetical protein